MMLITPDVSQMTAAALPPLPSITHVQQTAEPPPPAGHRAVVPPGDPVYLKRF